MEREGLLSKTLTVSMSTKGKRPQEEGEEQKKRNGAPALTFPWFDAGWYAQLLLERCRIPFRVGEMSTHTNITHQTNPILVFFFFYNRVSPALFRKATKRK